MSKMHLRHSITQRKKEELLKAFRKADKDGSGLLTKEEYIGVFRDQGVNISGQVRCSWVKFYMN